MEIQVDVKAAEVLLRLGKGQKRMVYAVAEAVNKTAKAVQSEVRAQVASSFRLRGQREFVLRQAAVIAFAKPKEGTVDAKVSVDPRGRLLLAGYEKGFTRTPKRGSKVAVPAVGGARPTKVTDIPGELFIKALRLRRAPGRRTKRSGPKPLRAVVKGLQRTYVVPEVGIFQRISQGITRLLYGFARPYRVAPRLHFFDTAKRVIDRDFKNNLLREIGATFAFQRNRGLN